MVRAAVTRRPGRSGNPSPAAYPGAVSNETRRPGDLLVRTGAIVFIIGAVATAVTITPLFIGGHPLPTAAYLVSMLMGVGMALALVGLLRAALAQRRATREAAAAR
nr:hypothetical protein [Streptomyces sp. SID5468]